MRRASICLLIAASQQLTVAQAPVDRGLAAAWSLEGRWTGVAVDQQAGLIYTRRYASGAEVDPAGQIRREFRLPLGEGRTLRFAKFPSPTLIAFSRWGPDDVSAFDLRGTRLWTYPKATGVDEVWIGDLDGDQSDEVVIGYNANSGVHVVDGKGQLRWKSTAIGNVWHVTVGDVQGRGRPQVVTTSALGRVHVFATDTNKREDVFASGIYVTMVRAAKLSANAEAATIFAAGSALDSKVSTVVALAGDGKRLWQLQLPSEVVAADVASTRPWLALATRDGHVFVVDAVKKQVVGIAEEQGNAEIAWIGDPPLLLVATGQSLNAFYVAAQ